MSDLNQRSNSEPINENYTESTNNKEDNKINGINNNNINNNGSSSSSDNLNDKNSLLCMINKNLNILNEALAAQQNKSMLDSNPVVPLLLSNHAANFDPSLSNLNEMSLNLNEFYRMNQFSKLTVSSPNNEASSKSSSYEFSSPESIYQRSFVKNNNHNMFNSELEREEVLESGDESNGIGLGVHHQPQQYTKLFVGNLPMSTTFQELLAIFKKYGPINEKLSVLKDQNYAFIHFYNRKDAELALNEVNDSLFKDRYIRVQFSTSPGFVPKHKSKQTIIFCFHLIKILIHFFLRRV
jgi:hypothetical protein